MPTAAISGGIGALGDIFGGILGSNASKGAAGSLSSAYNQAGDLANQGFTQANQQLGNMYGTEMARTQPFLQGGQDAFRNLSSLMAPGGALTQGFQAPTGLTMQNDPGYQERLKLGQTALENSAAARGNLLTGGTATDLTKFAQDYASNEYGNVYNRAFNTFESNQGNLFNRLMGLSQMGQNAAGMMNQATQNRMGSYADLTVGNALNRGQDLLGAAGANAGGILGSANSLNGMFGNLANLGSMIPYQMGNQGSPMDLSGFPSGASPAGTVAGLPNNVFNPANFMVNNRSSYRG